MGRWRLPLRIRVAIGAAALTVLTAAAFGALAFITARQSALDAAATRVRTAAFNFANRSGVGLGEVLRSVTEAAADSAIVATLRTSTPSAPALAVLQRLAADTLQTFATSVRDLSRNIVARYRNSPPAWALDPVRRRDTSAIGRMFARGDTILFEFAAPVVHRGRPLGEVVMTRRVRASPATAQTITDLMGDGGTMVFGNQDGSLWTDLGSVVGGPQTSGSAEYVRDGVARIGAVHSVPGTPFLFGAELPRSQVLAPARRLLGNLLVTGGLIVAIGLIAAWRFGTGIARPLDDFTSAAEGIAAGRELHTPLASETGTEEVARLDTAFSEMAERVRQARTDLEQKVLERTRALEHAQAALIRKERLAVLGQLAGSIGHELRNPLGVMNNSIEYLRATLRDAPPKALRHLELLQQQIGLSNRIVSAILDWSRVRTPVVADVAVSELVSSQISRMSVPPDHRMEVDVPAGIPPLRVDPDQIGQVLHNLLLNGLQAMDGKPGALMVRARNGNGRVQLEIEDEGPGVPAELEAQIFEPLFTTKPRGIGLGLALSRSLTVANGGNIHVARGAAGGARFILDLPAASREPSSTDRGASPPSNPVTAPASGPAPG